MTFTDVENCMQNVLVQLWYRLDLVRKWRFIRAFSIFCVTISAINFWVMCIILYTKFFLNNLSVNLMSLRCKACSTCAKVDYVDDLIKTTWVSFVNLYCLFITYWLIDSIVIKISIQYSIQLSQWSPNICGIIKLTSIF